jgi:hypothetical protein
MPDDISDRPGVRARVDIFLYCTVPCLKKLMIDWFTFHLISKWRILWNSSIQKCEHEHGTTICTQEANKHGTSKGSDSMIADATQCFSLEHAARASRGRGMHTIRAYSTASTYG